MKAGIVLFIGELPVSARPKPLKITIVPRVAIKAFILPLTTSNPFIAPTDVPISRPASTEKNNPSGFCSIIVIIPVKAITDPTERSNDPLISNTVIPAAMIPIITACSIMLARLLIVKKFLSSNDRAITRISIIIINFWSIKILVIFFIDIIASFFY